MWTHRLSNEAHQRSQRDHRDPYERDRTRVIHCPAFRRLQRKTQILGTDEGDFHRTRLTHSLEVASIGSSIVRNLKALDQNQYQALLPSDDLITTICLLHDIGHPPFGHGGEAALNYKMRLHGGFEGNAQTLRLLTKVEDSYGAYGLDLTRRSLLGILKYPQSLFLLTMKELPQAYHAFNTTLCINDWLPPKGYYDCETPEVAWLLSTFTEQDKILFQSLSTIPTLHAHGKTAYRTFDCSIMNIADDIAYSVHDLEDAIHLQLINRMQLVTADCKQILSEANLSMSVDAFLDLLFSTEVSSRKQAIGELVNYFVTAIQLQITHEDFENPVFKYNVGLLPEARALLLYLKHCIYDHVIDSQASRTLEYRGQMIILHLFDALSANPSSLLDKVNRERYRQCEDERTAFRQLSDYIANMTDDHASRLYERLFGFGNPNYLL